MLTSYFTCTLEYSQLYKLYDDKEGECGLVSDCDQFESTELMGSVSIEPVPDPFKKVSKHSIPAVLKISLTYQYPWYSVPPIATVLATKTQNKEYSMLLFWIDCEPWQLAGFKGKGRSCYGGHLPICINLYILQAKGGGQKKLTPCKNEQNCSQQCLAEHVPFCSDNI